MPKSICIEDGCGAPVIGRRLCGSHYTRRKRAGVPMPPTTAEIKRAWAEALLAENPDECRQWPWAKYPDGYGAWRFGREQRAHRVVCAMVHGPAPADRPNALHSCGKGRESCVTPSHLRWGTIAENNAEMVQHGTSTRGTKQWKHKLTDADVLEIRARYARGEYQRVIAKDYGIHRGTVGTIVNRKTWGWLD